MGVLVLPPQDLLRDGAHHHRRRLISPPRPKPRRGPTTTTTTTTPVNTRSGRRKQWSPTGSPPPPQSKADRAKSPIQIRILKRGEELAPTKPSVIANPDRSTKRASSVDRFDNGPVSPPTVPIRRARSVDRPDSGSVMSNPIRKPLVNGFYAGSAFSTSPPPSSLPVPAFCSKMGALAAVEEVADDLRRILRLEF